MDPIIIPSKLIVTIGDNGKAVDAVLQYKVRVDGAVDARFRTMNVKRGLSEVDTDTMVQRCLDRVKLGEGTNLIKVRESEAKIKERVQERLKKAEGGKK